MCPVCQVCQACQEFLSVEIVVYASYVGLVLLVILPTCVVFKHKFMQQSHHIFIQKRRPEMIPCLCLIAVLLITLDTTAILISLSSWLDTPPYIATFIQGLPLTFFYILCLRCVSVLFFFFFEYYRYLEQKHTFDLLKKNNNNKNRYFLLFYDFSYQSDLIAWKWLLIVIDSKLAIYKYQIPWTMRYIKLIKNWKLLAFFAALLCLLLNLACRYSVSIVSLFIFLLFICFHLLLCWFCLHSLFLLF